MLWLLLTKGKVALLEAESAEAARKAADDPAAEVRGVYKDRETAEMMAKRYSEHRHMPLATGQPSPVRPR